MPLIEQWRQKFPWITETLAVLAGSSLGLGVITNSLTPFSSATISSPIENQWEHPLRGQILRTLQKSPGIHFRELQRQLSAANGTLRHHIDVLNNQRSLTIVRVNGRVCYYAGAPSQIKVLRSMGIEDDERAASLMPVGLSEAQKLVLNEYLGDVDTVVEEINEQRPEYENKSEGFLKIRRLNQSIIIKSPLEQSSFEGWEQTGFTVTMWVRFLNTIGGGSLFTYGNPFLRNSSSFRLETLTKQPGDMLYFPRGFVHFARTPTDSKHSLHLTVSTGQTNSYVYLMEIIQAEALRNAIETSVAMRRGVARGLTSKLAGVRNESKSDSQDRASFLRHVRGMCDYVRDVSHDLVDAAVDQLARKRLRGRLPIEFPTRWKSDLALSSSHTEVRLVRRDVLHLAIEQSEDGETSAVVYHCARNSCRTLIGCHLNRLERSKFMWHLNRGRWGGPQRVGPRQSLPIVIHLECQGRLGSVWPQSHLLVWLLPVARLASWPPADLARRQGCQIGVIRSWRTA